MAIDLADDYAGKFVRASRLREGCYGQSESDEELANRGDDRVSISHVHSLPLV
jgi:hypothetical protein